MDSSDTNYVRSSVFVVEDDPAMRRTVVSVLEHDGFEVQPFESAEAFLRAYDGLAAGCLVLDVHLPGMSGLELQDELNRRGARFPVVIVSAKADVPMAVKALKFGATDFIEKPFTKTVLLESIRHVMQFADLGGEDADKQVAAPTAHLAALESERRKLQARLSEVEKELGDTVERERAMARQVDALMKTASQLIEERLELLTVIEEARQRPSEVSSAQAAASQERLAAIESELSKLGRTLDLTRAVAAENLKQAQAEAQREIESLNARLQDAVVTADELRRELEKREGRDLDLGREASGTSINSTESKQKLTELAEQHALLQGRLDAAETEAVDLLSVRGDEEKRAEALDRQLKEAMAEVDRLRAAHTGEKHRATVLDQELGEAVAEIDRLRAGHGEELRQGTSRESERMAEEIRGQSSELLRQEALPNEIIMQLQAAADARRAMEEALAGERKDRAAEAAALGQLIAELRGSLGKQLDELTSRFGEICASGLREPALPHLPDVRIPLEPSPTGTSNRTDPAPVKIGVQEASLDQLPVSPPAQPNDFGAVLEGRRVVLLDDGPLVHLLEGTLEQHTWTGVTIAPSADSDGQLVGLDVGPTFVNLGDPAAWRTVCNGRRKANARQYPVIAYVCENTAQRGVFLGRVDLVELPNDSEQLASAVKHMSSAAKRVILLTGDMDSMAPIRERLRAEGISAALVFDERQLVDLLPIVRPEAVLLHLSSTCRDMFRGAWIVRNKEDYRRIPLLFLLDGEPNKEEPKFLAKGIKILAQRATYTMAELAAMTVRELDSWVESVHSRLSKVEKPWLGAGSRRRSL